MYLSMYKLHFKDFPIKACLFLADSLDCTWNSSFYLAIFVDQDLYQSGHYSHMVPRSCVRDLLATFTLNFYLKNHSTTLWWIVFGLFLHSWMSSLRGQDPNQKFQNRSKLLNLKANDLMTFTPWARDHRSLN